MKAKAKAARRAVFFDALAATGNLTIAATRAKVSRSWVTLHKRTDPAFREQCATAMATARARLADAGGTAPDPVWGDIGGEELVIRGTNGVRAQISRARMKQWTARTEAIFLRTLAATANVRAACRAAELSVASAYVHRAKYPGFYRRWAKAIEIGAGRLELQMIETACNTLEGAEIDADAPLPRMDVEQCFRVLQMYRKAQDARWRGNRSHTFGEMPSVEAVQDEILKKLAALRRGRAAQGRAAAFEADLDDGQAVRLPGPRAQGMPRERDKEERPA